MTDGPSRRKARRRAEEPGPDECVPGRPLIRLSSLTSSARSKVLKDQAEFNALCARLSRTAVQHVYALMAQGETHAVRLRAAELLMANAWGTPRQQRGADDDRVLTVRVEGGLPPEV